MKLQPGVKSWIASQGRELFRKRENFNLIQRINEEDLKKRNIDKMNRCTAFQGKKNQMSFQIIVCFI